VKLVIGKSVIRTQLTKVGKLFLALMGLFYIASVTSQSGLLLLLIGILGGSFVVNYFFATRGIARLVVQPPAEAVLVEGTAPAQPWRITNPLGKNVEVIEIESRAGLLFRVRVIAAAESVSVVPHLIYERRGVYPHSELVISSAAPYGLVRAARKITLPGEVVVFPRVYEAESPATAGLDMVTGGRLRGGRRVNNGANFAGVRAWQSGDSIKQIHWKTTARRQELMVKTFEEELGGRVCLVVDCDPSAPLETVDLAVRAAASLGAAALQDGHHVELMDSRGGDPLRLAPFSDEAELLDRLARYEPSPRAGDDSDDFPAAVRRRATLALVGTAWREAWAGMVEAARQGRRKVCVYLPENAATPAGLGAELFHFGAASIFPAEMPAAESKHLSGSVPAGAAISAGAAVPA